jgi:hypothetical protein
MPMDLQIRISDLRKITNLIFDHVEQDLNISSVPIEEDYYWHIPSKVVYKVEQDPPTPDIGQLYDDWEFLAKIKQREDAVSLAMIHLAPLLRHIGEKIGQ